MFKIGALIYKVWCFLYQKFFIFLKTVSCSMIYRSLAVVKQNNIWLLLFLFFITNNLILPWYLYFNGPFYNHILDFPITLFLVGFIGIFFAYKNKNLLVFIMCIETILLGIIVGLVATSLLYNHTNGQIYALCILGLAACETAIGLGLIVSLYRSVGSVRFVALTQLRMLLMVITNPSQENCPMCCCLTNAAIMFIPTILVFLLIYLIHVYIPAPLLSFLKKIGVTRVSILLTILVIFFLIFHTTICIVLFRLILTPHFKKYLFTLYCKGLPANFIKVNCMTGWFAISNVVFSIITLIILIYGIYHTWIYIKNFSKNQNKHI